MKICLLALVNAQVPSCIWNVRAEGLTFFNVRDRWEKVPKYSVSPGTHLPSASTFSHAVLTTRIYGNTDAFQYWYGSILTGLSINLQDFKQKIRSKALEWPAPPREMNATWSISLGSDYKGEIVFQITHLPLRFSETMQVFPSLTPNGFFKVITRDCPNPDIFHAIVWEIQKSSIVGTELKTTMEAMAQAVQSPAFVRVWADTLP